MPAPPRALFQFVADTLFMFSGTKLIAILLLLLILLGALAACSPLRTLNTLASSSSYRTTAGLAYGDSERQRLDLYVPRELTAPAPVVVFFYGGSWNSGKRGDYAFVGAALAERGIIAVVADYRLYPEVRYPTFLEDSARAVAWTVRNVAAYGGDSSRIFVMGHSAGAYNAAMVALDARWLKAYGFTPDVLRGWIGLAGPYDFLPIRNPDVQPVFFHPNTPPDSQPVRHVEKGARPALLIAATNDALVHPERNTGGMAKQLRAAGAQVTEHYFPKVSHATLIASLAWPLRGLAPTLDTIVQFVEETRPQQTAEEVIVTSGAENGPIPANERW